MHENRRNDIPQMSVEDNKKFHNTTLNLYSLNFRIITLLLKQDDATHIKQFWPICLLM
jgi:hypothetical protein